MAWISLNNLARFFKQMLVKNITWKGQHTFASNTTFSGGLSSTGGSNLSGGTTINGDFSVTGGIHVFARPSPNQQPVSIMKADINGLKYKGSDVATKAMLPTQNSQLENDSGYLSPTSLEIQELRAAMASIPTKTSQLTNDSGYVSYSDGKSLEVGNYLDLHDNNNMDVDYTFRIFGNGQIVRNNGVYIQVLDSGHLSINGSELWIE